MYVKTIYAVEAQDVEGNKHYVVRDSNEEARKVVEEQDGFKITLEFSLKVWGKGRNPKYTGLP